MNAAAAKFEVTDHFSITGRGVVVVGTIADGTFRIGMTVPTGRSEKPYLTISAIECVDNISKRIYRQGLMFQENPSLQFAREAFPSGSTIVAFENKSTAPTP